ncbi:MAG: hypothetical protein IPK34_04695 [Ramlibacter sp.]|nr:hypothetical protein [Ramlibacter sp.]
MMFSWLDAAVGQKQSDCRACCYGSEFASPTRVTPMVLRPIRLKQVKRDGSQDYARQKPRRPGREDFQFVTTVVFVRLPAASRETRATDMGVQRPKGQPACADYRAWLLLPAFGDQRPGFDTSLAPSMFCPSFAAIQSVSTVEAVGRQRWVPATSSHDVVAGLDSNLAAHLVPGIVHGAAKTGGRLQCRSWRQ